MKISDKPLCDFFFAYMDKALGYVKNEHKSKQEFKNDVVKTAKNGISMCQLLLKGKKDAEMDK